jgi:antitoxin ParD1/3/4
MEIGLTPEQEAWLQAQVATGDFASLEEAVRQLLGERIAERTVERSDDLEWAKPDVNEARIAVERGEFVSLEEHRAHNAALLESLRTRWRA